MMNELLEQAYIKEIKPQLLYQFKKQDKSSIYGITQRLMAYNSNRIEGSTLTEDQTASIFETGTIMAEPDELFRTKDVEEMTGHFRMFNYCLTCLDAPLSIEMIKQMHYHLKVGVFEDMANGYPCGEFKNRANRVSNIITSQPGEVAEHMEALLDSYHESSEHSLEDLAKFHARYETIHPFQDGNGRTGRMILFRESLKNNMIPVIIRDETKQEYQHALNLAQTKGETEKLLCYFKSEQQEYFEKTKDYVLPYQLLEQYKKDQK